MYLCCDGGRMYFFVRLRLIFLEISFFCSFNYLKYYFVIICNYKMMCFIILVFLKVREIVVLEFVCLYYFLRFGFWYDVLFFYLVF